MQVGKRNHGAYKSIRILQTIDFSNLQKSAKTGKTTILTHIIYQIVRKSVLSTVVALFSLSLVLLNASKAVALQAVMTHDLFYAPEGNGLKPYVEIYWEIDPHTLLFDKKEGLWTGKIKTDIVITKDLQVVAEEHYFLQTRPAAEIGAIYAQRIMDLKRLSLDTGTYKIDVLLTDEVRKGGEYKYSQLLTIKESEKPFFSDIQIVDTVLSTAGTENVFSRNGRLQIPLCANFLDDNRKTLKYYAELYNTNEGPDAKQVKIFISRKENQGAVYDRTANMVLRQDKLQVIDGFFDISMLSSGNYYLNMAFVSENDSQLAHQSVFFQLVNTKPTKYTVEKQQPDSSADNKKGPVYLNLSNTYLSKYSPEQIRAILKMIVPIATPTERNNINEFLRKPDDMYSRYLIYNFWLSRNADDPEAEWKKYAEKVKTVNKLFGTAMVKGYESERGRVYILYGEPTERVRVENEEGTYPYEVWQYNTMGEQANVLFLFVRSGFVGSDYLLTHSTAKGERVNNKWRSNLYLSGVPTSTNSRADQYFGNR